MLISLLTRLLGSQYDTHLTATGAYTMLFVFAAFLAMAYFFPDEERMDEETMGLRNVLYLVLLLQCFSPLHTLAMRMNYYFIIFVPVLLPKIFKCSKTEYSELADFSAAGLTIFFVVYFLLNIVKAYVSGGGLLGSVPYVPFWKL